MNKFLIFLYLPACGPEACGQYLAISLRFKAAETCSIKLVFIFIVVDRQSAYYVSGTMVSTLHIEAQLLFTTALRQILSSPPCYK